MKYLSWDERRAAMLAYFGFASDLPPQFAAIPSGTRKPSKALEKT
jgi:hypothetical protein